MLAMLYYSIFLFQTVLILKNVVSLILFILQINSVLKCTHQLARSLLSSSWRSSKRSARCVRLRRVGRQGVVSSVPDSPGNPPGSLYTRSRSHTAGSLAGIAPQRSVPESDRCQGPRCRKRQSAVLSHPLCASQHCLINRVSSHC